MKLAWRVLKFLLFVFLLCACFGIPLLVLSGFEPNFPDNKSIRDFSTQGYLSVWWGKLVIGGVGLLMGWLYFWAIIGNKADKNSSHHQSEVDQKRRKSKR